jgi:hypothetical protein
MNVGRCARCGHFLIEEQSQTHRCEIQIKQVKEIVRDWITDGAQDPNDDTVKTGLGIDGILYRLILCKHSPPHRAKRKFTNDDEQPPDKLPVYL